MTQAFLAVLLSRTHSRQFARAFSTTATRTTLLGGSRIPTADRRNPKYGPNSAVVSRTGSMILAPPQTLGVRFMSTIEEEQDLDAALDSILGGETAKYKQNRNGAAKNGASKNGATKNGAAVSSISNGASAEQHIGHPMPKTLVEQVRYLLSC